MRVLAIDPGLKTGWAYSDGTFIESDVEDFLARHRESRGMVFMRFRTWLGLMLMVWDVELVVYEQAHLRGGAATELIVGMTTRIQEECCKHCINYTAIHSATLKKYATGSGRAKKEDVIRVAQERYGKKGLTSDEADALMMLAWAREEYA